MKRIDWHTIGFYLQSTIILALGALCIFTAYLALNI